MLNLMSASSQFMSRPDDERFTSLISAHEFAQDQKDRSRVAVVANKKLRFVPSDDAKGLMIEGRNENAVMTHWSFNQAAGLASFPAGTLRAQCEHGLAALAADNLNAGFGVIRDVEEVGMLARYNGHAELAAATGPRYGRIWNADITKALIAKLGDGVTGDWRVPGTFGKPLDQVTKDMTTIYVSDRDLFIFLADENNRIEMPGRRAGMMGNFARGIIVENSEVGSRTLRLSWFLFDYVCCNRIIWGVENFEEIAIRHTAAAPERWLREIMPTVGAYAKASSTPIQARLQAAQNQKLDDAKAFLAKRFTPRTADLILAAHLREEERPVESLWDAVTATTAFAKTMGNSDTRVEWERAGGELLKLAA